jgi:hypothetical protein
MARALSLAWLTAAWLAFLPAGLTAQKKNQEVADAATDQDYKQLQSIHDMTGKLVSVDTKSVTFRLDIPNLVPNPKYHPPKGANNQYRQLQNIYRQQAQIMASRNPIQQQVRMQQLMATLQRDQYQMLVLAAASSNPNNQPFLLAHQYKDYDLELSDKVAVRKTVLEKMYDEKGNLKVPGEEEKEKLRGKDNSKPGYQADLEDLRAGLQVKIYLKMPKKATPASAADIPADKTDKDKTEAKDKVDKKDNVDAKAKVADKADAAADKAKTADLPDGKSSAKDEVVKPIITMIVILQSLDQPVDVPPAKKKKDN